MLCILFYQIVRYIFSIHVIKFFSCHCQMVAAGCKHKFGCHPKLLCFCFLSQQKLVTGFNWILMDLRVNGLIITKLNIWALYEDYLWIALGQIWHMNRKADELFYLFPPMCLPTSFFLSFVTLGSNLIIMIVISTFHILPFR